MKLLSEMPSLKAQDVRSGFQSDLGSPRDVLPMLHKRKGISESDVHLPSHGSVLCCGADARQVAKGSNISPVRSLPSMWSVRFRNIAKLISPLDLVVHSTVTETYSNYIGPTSDSYATVSVISYVTLVDDFQNRLESLRLCP